MAREAPIEIIAGKRQFIDFTMTFSDDWSVEANRGNPITLTLSDGVFLSIKRHKTDAGDALLTLKDEDAGGADTQIEWIGDGTTGVVRVKFGSNTATFEGTYDYELTVKLSTGDYISVKQGKINVTPSVTGNPVIEA